MAPADNTPDFDSMSPEEIMAWMETLAKRQGVKSEELTTSADVDIPEIDPDSVVIDEPGYVPYGEERPPKPASPPPSPVRHEPLTAARPADAPFPAQAQTLRPSEPPFPPPSQAPRPFSAPPPRPQAASPEEPQGPARPLTPLAPRPSAPPSGLNPLRPPSVPPTRPMPTAPSTPPRAAPDFAPRPAAQTPIPPADTPRQTPDLTSRPPSQPAAQTPPAQPPARPPISIPPNPRTAFEPPKWLTSRPLTGPLASAPPPPVESKSAPEPEKTVSEDTDAMKWLESLAADQGDSLFNLDLSSLMGPPVIDEAPATSLNPVAWLQDLAGTQAEDDATAIFARVEPPQPTAAPEPPGAAAPVSSADIPTVADPFDSGVDPIAWLENLARRQGAKSEELTTSVSMEIPVPENPVIDEPGYNPFSFDAPIERRQTQHNDTPFTLDDPDSWPDLTPDTDTGEPVASSPTDDVSAIERAISEGTVSPEQMQAYLEHQTDLYVDDLASDADTADDDAPPVPAELPDWLLEQVGAPPVDLPIAPAAEAAAEPDVFDDMPEWLREDADQTDAASLLGIFDDIPAEEDSQSLTTDPEFAGYTIEIDRSDPWVEAFEAEQEDGLPDITELPGWYVENLNDPERIAAVDQMADAPALADAALPVEAELKPGQPVDLPSWASLPEEEPALVTDLPDWLLELDASGVTNVEPEEIPDWLNEDNDVIEVEPETFAPVVITPEPARAAPPVQPRPEPTAAAAPAQRPAASADLQAARTHADSGDVETSVAHYEALIRVNRELDAVVDDLTRLSKLHRANPAVHRVLGDGLMRQGKLQAALDVYREALNQL